MVTFFPSSSHSFVHRPSPSARGTFCEIHFRILIPGPSIEFANARWCRSPSHSAASHPLAPSPAVSGATWPTSPAFKDNLCACQAADCATTGSRPRHQSTTVAAPFEVRRSPIAGTCCPSSASATRSPGLRSPSAYIGLPFASSSGVPYPSPGNSSSGKYALPYPSPATTRNQQWWA